jgi:hypothetical protein
MPAASDVASVSVTLAAGTAVLTAPVGADWLPDWLPGEHAATASVPVRATPIAHRFPTVLVLMFYLSP